ncbi:hypothetical protein BCR43DRAFT_490540 [Syncephalastrum racemosum]|uniref:Uncharacterized protein n=1 Tax=Syncephalastrum racemosum TaxID=13706 RepID=A0A1X2HHJ8_SYNRA|nr:hypothetical protein BCR43DRAFT_490540 [Syncephalastrum racemosum]
METEPAVPLTPPETRKPSFSSSTGLNSRKLSVTFDLSNLPSTPREEKDIQLLSPSNSIDISAQAVPDTILVALLDRDQEMRQLVSHNHAFFSALRTHLHPNWDRFENTLYCPRSQMPDVDWIKRIEKAMQAAPSLLQQFYDLVGYVEQEDYPSTSSEPLVAHFDIARLRNYPKRLEALPTAYPQLFVNCRQSMTEDEADEFMRLLLTPRSSMPDDLWEMAIYDQLDRWPNLVDQLHEIIAYEVECGEHGDSS